MKFQRGQSGNPNGRPPGSPNKFTMAVRDAFQQAFEDSGGVKALTEWAIEHRGEFYRLVARMIPYELTGKDGADLFAHMTTDELKERARAILGNPDFMRSLAE